MVDFISRGLGIAAICLTAGCTIPGGTNSMEVESLSEGTFTGTAGRPWQDDDIRRFVSADICPEGAQLVDFEINRTGGKAQFSGRCVLVEETPT